MQRKLTFLPLALLIVSAIDSNRNLPSIAIFGSPLIFYFLFAALFFLFPTALVSAELGSSHPDKEGIYHWVKHAFGEKWAMAAIWLQWVNTVVWFPTILSFIAGAIAYLFDPKLLEDKIFMMCGIAAIFWGLTWVNMRGLHVSARLNNLFVLIGTLIPMCFLILLGLLWLKRGEPIEISFASNALFPQLEKFDSWVALVAVIGSFLGMELAGVHVAEVHQPRKTFPLALGVSSVVILATMLFGSLTIAAVLNQSDINLAGGIMQVFGAIFRQFGLEFLIPVATVLIVLGSVGGLINWMISPSKGLLFAARHGYLPIYFTQLNDRGAASKVLLAQALIVTLLCGLLLYLPSVNGFYWLLSALSTALYMLMYVLMFFSALRFRSRPMPETTEKQFRIPGGKAGLWLTCAAGILGCSLTFMLGFVPPPNVNVGSSLQYTCLIGGGIFLFVLPVFGTFLYKGRPLN